MSRSPQSTKHFRVGSKERIVRRKMNQRVSAGVSGRRLQLTAICLSLVLAALGAAAAPAALAGAPEFTLHSGFADTFEAGKRFRISLAVENTGTAPFTGTLTVSDVFPAGLVPTYVEPEGAPAQCEINGQEVACGFAEEGMNPAGHGSIYVWGFAEASATGSGVNVIDILGNGAASDVHLEEPVVFGAPQPFALESFTPNIARAGSPETQAGAAPEVIETEFTLPSHPLNLFELAPNGIAASEHVHNIIVHSPPGVVANLDATPVKCKATELTEAAPNSQMSKCPVDSQVGTIRLVEKRYVVPVYNMVPPPGVPAEVAFSYQGVAVTVEAHLRPDDFGFDLVTRDINSEIPLTDIGFKFRRVPVDASHDTERGLCSGGNGHCPSTAPRKAFLR